MIWELDKFRMKKIDRFIIEKIDIMRIVSKEIELNFAPMPENTGVLAFLRRKKFIPKSDLVLRRNSALESS